MRRIATTRKAATKKTAAKKPVRKTKTGARAPRSGTQQVVSLRDLKKAFVRLFEEQGWTIRFERHGASDAESKDAS